MSLSNLAVKLKPILLKYSKEELLLSCSALSVFPGNELLQYRFAFIEHLISSIQEEEFQKSAFSHEEVANIIKITDDDIWMQVEDWEPITNSKSNYITLDGNKYNFIIGDLISIQDTIREIVRRLYEFEDIIMKKFNYSIISEFSKILEYNTRIINLIDISKDKYSKLENLVIPDKSFISEYKIALDSYLCNEIFWRNDAVKYKENLESITTSYPIIDNKAYLPFFLIIKFYRIVCNDLNSIIDDNINNIINNQLKLEIFESLTELLPSNAVINDVTINDSAESLDFFVYVENTILAFKFVTGLFAERINKINSLKSFFKKLETVQNQKNVKLQIGKDTEYIHNVINVIPIIVEDDLFIEETVFRLDYKVVLVSYNDLRHICEDVFDMEKKDFNILDLVNIFLKYINGNSPLIGGFFEFYLMMSRQPYQIGNAENKGHPLLLTVGLKTEFLIRKYIDRPLLDLNPYNSPIHYFYKIIKDSDSSVYGYNKIMNQQFWCLFRNKNVYIVINRDNLTDSTEEKMAIFISEFIKFYTIKIFNSVNISEKFNNDIIIEIITKKSAIKKNIKKDGSYPIIITGNYEGKFFFIFDATKIPDIYITQSERLIQFMADKLFKSLIIESEHELVNNVITEYPPKNYFGIQKEGWLSNPESKKLLFPSHINFSEVELLILNKFNSIKSGEYEDIEAKKIINEICVFLDEVINGRIQKYNFVKFVTFGYREIENTTKIRKEYQLQYMFSRNFKLEYDPHKFAADFELKMQAYHPSCRYLVEKAVCNKIDGNSEISSEEWRFLCAVTMKRVTLISVSDFLHNVPKLTKVKITVKENELFNIEIVKIPTQKYFVNFSSIIKNSGDRKELLSETKHIDEISFKNMMEEGSLKNINDKLESVFGFRLYQYSNVIDAAIEIWTMESKSEILDIPKNSLIQKIAKKVALDDNIVENIIDFSTLYIDGEEKLELWKVNTRKNRLTIRAFIAHDDNLIYGPEMIFAMRKQVILTILDGAWIYNRETINRDLETALRIRQLEIAKSFEENMFHEIKKVSDFQEKNICQDINDKCFTDVKEKCPGQIDILSIHVEKKKIVVWEAKDKEERYGSKELLSDYKEFVKKYIDKVNIKADFVKKYLSNILKYYNIIEQDGWQVVPCIILSNDNLLKSILEQEFPVISYTEVESFLKKI